ncbi:MAG: fimbrillin family protein [Tannerellaceae bacterium]
MNKFYLFATSAALVFSSCSNNSTNADVEIPEGNIKSLSLLVDIETSTTKSGSTPEISGEVTTDNLNQIGVHICPDENFGTEYISGSYNTTWTKSNDSWTPRTPVFLGSDNANVYAYHPYNENAELNVAAVPVTVGNTDYLFGKAENNNAIFVANNQNATASINLKHAMTQIIWNFTKEDTFTGNAEITKISMNKLHKSGTLDIKTGKITATGNDAEHTLNVNMTAPTSKNFMMIPRAYEANTLTMSFTIDGKIMTSTFDKVITFEQGKIHNINIKLKGTGIVIESVTVAPWGDGADQDIDIN